MPEMQNAPKTNTKKIIIAAAVILAIGVGLQQYFKYVRDKGDAGSSANTRGSIEKISVKANMDGWREYTNSKLGFSAKYPANATLRGTEESDLAIVTLERSETENKQALIILTKKKIPLNQGPYATMEAFWEQEQQQIMANNGVASEARYVEVSGRTFWEAREDNRQNNYMGLHRYIKETSGIYEAALTVEGDKLLGSATEAYNAILHSFVIR